MKLTERERYYLIQSLTHIMDNNIYFPTIEALNILKRLLYKIKGEQNEPKK